MPSKLLGPDFEDFTITCGNLRWLHSCRWEGSHAEDYYVLRGTFSSSMGKAPNLVKSKTQPSPSVSAQWLLVDEEEVALAWAELQNFPSTHDRWGMLFWGSKTAFAEHDASVTRLVGLCFVVGKFDHMRLVAAGDAEATLLDTYAQTLGEKREIYVFPSQPWHPGQRGLRKMTSLELARNEWVTAPIAQDESKTLQHIQSRISRFEKSQKFLAPKQKKRSLLARLMRPKIDDPLF